MIDVLPSIEGLIMRGTTPIFIFDFDFSILELSSIRICFMQGNKTVFVKDEDDIVTDSGAVEVKLSQEETYKLSAKKRLEVRFRFKRNNSPVVGAISKFYDVLDSGKPEEALVPITPEYIRITTLPDKLSYADGESIDITGIVVKAYYSDESEWGIVPNDELIISPTVATGGEDTGIYTNGNGLRALRVPMHRVNYSGGATEFVGDISVGHSASSNHYEMTLGASKSGDLYGNYCFFITAYNGNVYVISNLTYTNSITTYRMPEGVSTGSYGQVFQAWWGSIAEVTSGFFVYDLIPTSTVAPSGSISDLYPEPQNESISVSWARVGDGAILSDEYEIQIPTVPDRYTDGNGVNALYIKYEFTEGILGNDYYSAKRQLGYYDGHGRTLGSPDGEAELLITRYNGTIWARRISGADEFYLYQYPNSAGGSSTTYYTRTDLWTSGVWEQHLNSTDIPNSSTKPDTNNPSLSDMHPYYVY